MWCTPRGFPPKEWGSWRICPPNPSIIGWGLLLWSLTLKACPKLGLDVLLWTGRQRIPEVYHKLPLVYMSEGQDAMEGEDSKESPDISLSLTASFVVYCIFLEIGLSEDVLCILCLVVFLWLRFALLWEIRFAICILYSLNSCNISTYLLFDVWVLIHGELHE